MVNNCEASEDMFASWPMAAKLMETHSYHHCEACEDMLAQGSTAKPVAPTNYMATANFC